MAKERGLPPVRDWRTVPPLLTTEEVMVLLQCGRTHLDALLREGLPHINIGLGHGSGAGRTRRILRFEVSAVLDWLRERSAKSVVASARGTTAVQEREGPGVVPGPLPKAAAVVAAGVATGA